MFLIFSEIVFRQVSVMLYCCFNNNDFVLLSSLNIVQDFFGKFFKVQCSNVVILFLIIKISKNDIFWKASKKSDDLEKARQNSRKKKERTNSILGLMLRYVSDEIMSWIRTIKLSALSFWSQKIAALLKGIH